MAEKILEINSVSSSEVKNTVIRYLIVIGKNGSTGLIAYI